MTDLLDEELWYGATDRLEARAKEDAAKSVAAQVGRILGAKPFPIAATKLAELTRDDKTPLHKVVDVLENDPALSARLLRLVNSAGYALRTACTSVGHAAALVGTEKLNQVATTAAILDMYDSATPAAAQILEHATIVGALCRYVAVHLGLPPDELFTCGFLHDIGKLMLLDCEGERYLQVLTRVGAEPDIVHVKERELFGYDHAILAGHVLAAWHIPEPVPQVVAWHHQAARAYEDPLIARMVAVVRFCDAVSYCIFRPLPEPEIERLARSEACSYLEVSALQIGEMWPDLHTLAVKSRAGFRGEPLPADVEARSRSVQLASEPPANDNQVPAAADPAKAPAHFPCVVCGVPSYANQCPACHGYVCPGHQLGQDEWCYLCVDEFRRLELKFPRWVYLAMASVIALTGVVSIIGASAAAAPATMKWITAPGLGVACLAMLLFIWRRWLRRFWFLRTVANRAGFAPVVTDQVVQGITSLPPTAKRVINPFDIHSRRPVAVGLSTGVEYYSLPPSGSLAPLPLEDADSLAETLVLGGSDELVDLELGEPMMALASHAPASARRAEPSAAPETSNVDDPFAPEPDSSPPDDPFGDEMETPSEGTEVPDSKPGFTTDEDPADGLAEAERDSDAWSEGDSRDEPAGVLWSESTTDDASRVEDARQASAGDAEDSWDADVADDASRDSDAWQASAATEQATGGEADDGDDWGVESGDGADDGNDSDEQGDAWLTEPDEAPTEEEWDTGAIDEMAAGASAESHSATANDFLDGDDASEEDVWTSGGESDDEPSLEQPSDAGGSARGTDLEEDDASPWADLESTRSADEPGDVREEAAARDEPSAIPPAPPSADADMELPIAGPTDRTAESAPARDSQADPPSSAFTKNERPTPETSEILRSYTFRHPQAWRAIVESPGAADGW